MEYLFSWAMIKATIKATRGAEICVEVANSVCADIVGSFIPKPPRRTGSDNSSRSSGLQAGQPVRAGRNCW